ncbi:MAG TPA: hypothetical protein VFU65_04510 [Actinocrinis sp.]|nr:hypothetical protein [Actinocrinis sp.]
MVGISAIEQGAFVADRYRVVERLTRFAVADSTLTGVEYEYWLALDETRNVEVWLQVAASRDAYAAGSDLAGVVSALRRLNHPALPVVLDFGEMEVEREEAEAGSAGAQVDGAETADVVVERVGFVVLEPVEAESLATVLLRGALTEAEILAALVEIADVLKVLHEIEVVHGHLSAYSFLLAERGVLLIDLAAAAALEVASGSELTSAADVYALAWLACIALAGIEAVEAEFGVGFDAGSSPESATAPQLLTLELIERRRAWAEANLVATYGLRAQLAALLVAALGEASGRPTVGELVAALQVREDVAEAVEAEAAAIAVVEAAEAAVVAGAVVAAAQAAEAAQAVEVEEVEVAGQSEVGEAAEVGYAEAVEETAVAGELVGAGVAIGVGAEAISESGNRGRGGRGGSGRGAVSGLASAPLPPTASPSGRHGSPPQRPKSALYVAIAIVVLVVGAIAWGCSASGSSPSAKPSGAPTTAGQVSTGHGGGTGSSPSATAGQGGGAGTTPGASSAASPTQGTNSASPAAGSGSGPSSAPAYSATPMATAPGSPGQALQQIQQTISQAGSAGQIPQQAQGSLNHAVGTLQQEIGSKSSVQPGISQLRTALNESGVPTGFRQQINELIPYLSAGQGS